MPKEKPPAFEKAVALINVTERSEKGLRERLARAGYGQEEIDEAVSRCLDYGFVDDMRYASLLIRSRMNQGKGCDGIARELRGQGIDIESVPGWPEEFHDFGDERGRALTFLEKHPPHSKNLREGAYRKLVQKGYSVSVASETARKWTESQT